MLYDHNIREPLFEFLDNEFGVIRILEEVRIGKARADVLMVCNGNLYGIEIKSDADSYTRLKNQVRWYNKYFDYNIVCVGSRHAAHITDHIPATWGIIVVEEEQKATDFYFLRKPIPNPKMIWKKKLDILWRPELVKILAMNHLPAYKQKSKDFVIEKICYFLGNKVDEIVLKQQVADCLFERDYTTIEDEIAQYRKESHS